LFVVCLLEPFDARSRFLVAQDTSDTLSTDEKHANSVWRDNGHAKVIV
jgi:hypothetical protein